MNAYRQLLSVLRPLYDEREARTVAFLVLEQAFGVGRTAVYADCIPPFSETETARFRLIMERLSGGEPVQYVLGEAEFCGMRFGVSPAVLIPRPETEDLVAWVAEAAPCRVLDAGTGSGCIAIALKRLLPATRVEAWDLSEAALEVARTNAEALGADVAFRRMDMLSTAASDGVDENLTIVSNPPYICQREQADMEPHVLRHEPHTALFVPDDDPLRFYRALAEMAVSRRAKALYVETNRAYAEATAALFADKGLRHVEVRHDRFGNPRFVRGER